MSLMEPIDITDSLKAFRTVRTTVSNPRAHAQEELCNSEESTAEPVLSVLPTLLPLDQTAWLPLAERVLTGEFDSADNSTQESIIIGLRGIDHPVCQKAFMRIARKAKS